MAQISGWTAEDFERWKRGYNFKAGELAELEAISVNVAVVGLGDPRVSMDFDPNEFGVGLDTAEEAFVVASGSLASFSSLEDANQVVQSMGGVLSAHEDLEVAGDIPQGMPVDEQEAEQTAEVMAVEEEQVENQLQGPLTRKRKKDNGKAVAGMKSDPVRVGDDIGGETDSSKRACTEGGSDLGAGMMDRVGDHPEMMKRMDVKIAKFREYVMGLSVHSNMATSELARAMARVAKVPGEVVRMDGVSKMNLGVETLSAFGGHSKC